MQDMKTQAQELCHLLQFETESKEVGADSIHLQSGVGADSISGLEYRPAVDQA